MYIVLNFCLYTLQIYSSAYLNYTDKKFCYVIFALMFTFYITYIWDAYKLLFISC